MRIKRSPLLITTAVRALVRQFLCAVPTVNTTKPKSLTPETVRIFRFVDDGNAWVANVDSQRTKKLKTLPSVSSRRMELESRLIGKEFVRVLRKPATNGRSARNRSICWSVKWKPQSTKTANGKCRRASVYREFQDVHDFVEELQPILDSRRRES